MNINLISFPLLLLQNPTGPHQLPQDDEGSDVGLWVKKHYGGWGFIALSNFPFFFFCCSSVWHENCCMRVSSGGLWWGLFPRVARGARHGWCQGRKRRRGQAWCNPLGQLWQGETEGLGVAGQNIFSFTVWFSICRIIWNGPQSTAIAFFLLYFDECKMAVAHFALDLIGLHGLMRKAISLTLVPASLWLLLLLSVPVFGETAEGAGHTTNSQLRSLWFFPRTCTYSQIH